jgi:hypothetical protein
VTTKSLAERVAHYRRDPKLDAWLVRMRDTPPAAPRPRVPPAEQLTLPVELPKLSKQSWRQRLCAELLGR